MIRNLWNDLEGTFFPESALDYMPAERLREVQLQRLKAVDGAGLRARAALPRAHGRQGREARRRAQRSKTCACCRSPTKTDLRDTYPYGLFAVPMSEVVRLHASSGTTGKPIVVGYTAQDMEVWKQVIMRTLYAAGYSRGDVVQNMFGYGLFTGGLGLHGGIEGIGATVIPISGGNSERQIMVMKDFGVTAVCLHAELFHPPDRGRRRNWGSISSAISR